MSFTAMFRLLWVEVVVGSSCFCEAFSRVVYVASDRFKVFLFSVALGRSEVV